MASLSIERQTLIKWLYGSTKATVPNEADPRWIPVTSAISSLAIVAPEFDMLVAPVRRANGTWSKASITPNQLGTFNLGIGTTSNTVGQFVEVLSKYALPYYKTSDPQMVETYRNMLDVQGLSTKGNSISAFQGQLAATFVYANSVKNVLYQSAPNASGSDVQAYIYDVQNSLNKQIGTVRTFTDAINGLQYKLNDLGSAPLKDGFTLSTKAMTWIANGAPAIVSREGNIAYGSKYDYTLAAASNQAAIDLLDSATDFMVDSKKGLNQVVENKAYKDSQTLLNNVFGILGSILGLSATFTAIGNVSIKIADSVGKQIATTLAWGDGFKEGINLFKGVTDMSRSGLAFAPAVKANYQGKNEIRWESDWGSKLSDVLTKAFPGEVSSGLTNAVTRFKSSFGDLMSNMLRNMSDTDPDYLTTGSLIVDSNNGTMRRVVPTIQTSGVYEYTFRDFDGVTRTGSLNWNNKDFDKNGWIIRPIEVPGYMAAEIRMHRWVGPAFNPGPGKNVLDLQVVAWNPKS